MNNKKAVAPDYRESPMPMYQDIIATDAKTAPAFVRDYSEVEIDVPQVLKSRYTSRDFFDLEVKHMWSKVWQVACREEQIPEVGDCVLYDGPTGSFIIVRSSENEIKAHYNSCLHRGMKLCASDTSVRSLRCPFHGFTWNLDGTIKHVPAQWDFKHFASDELTLPHAKVEVWGGFVFINPDLEAKPLDQYLGHLPEHFAEWPRDKVYLATNIRKVIHSNWKACIEAFIEGFHVAELHSQGAAWAGDTSMQYDVWPGDDHVSRFMEPIGTPNDQLPAISEEKQLKDMYRMLTGSDELPEILPGTTLRSFIAGLNRENLSKSDGADYSHLSDAESLDAMQYSVFPNLVLFRSLLYPYAYRFVPLRNDPDKTVFDFMVFKPKPASGEVPETQHVNLEQEDLYSECGVFPEWLGEIYDQDAAGLMGLQEGLKAGGQDHIVLSNYQEVRIRHLHEVLARYLQAGGVDTAKL